MDPRKMSRQKRQQQEKRRQENLQRPVPTALTPAAPKPWYAPTSNRVMAAVMVIGLGVTFYQIHQLKKSQSESDVQVTSFRGELKRLSDSAEWMRQAEFAPHPTVETEMYEVPIRGPENLMDAADMTIRNFGRGSCYEFSARVVYDGMKKSSEREIKPGNVGPFDVLTDITLAAGQQKPFKIPKWILYPEDNPQVVTGRVEMKCRDEGRNLCLFVQPFWLIVHLDKTNPHAHFHFQSPIAITGKEFPLSDRNQGF
jgi:hypothetical protein